MCVWLQPREPWRVVEQQREELPVGESQQEHARQPEQQPGLSPSKHNQPKRGLFHLFFLCPL